MRGVLACRKLAITSHSMKGKIVKKSTKFFAKGLQDAIERNQKFRESNILHNANMVVNFVEEWVQLGHAHLSFNFSGSYHHASISTGKDVLGLFEEVRGKDSRMEAVLKMGPMKGVVYIDIVFFYKGKDKLLSFLAVVDSYGLLRLNIVEASSELESAKFLGSFVNYPLIRSVGSSGH